MGSFPYGVFALLSLESIEIYEFKIYEFKICMLVRVSEF
jgi:hypothetical protein